MEVELKDFAYWDESGGMWVVEKGQYDFSFGQSAGHIEGVVEMDIEGMRKLKI